MSADTKTFSSAARPALAEETHVEEQAEALTNAQIGAQAGAQAEARTEAAIARNDAVIEAGEAPAKVSLPLPPHKAAIQSMAFALSAFLSPYLVIPVGTVAIVASVSLSHREWLIWTALSILFSTVVPALYVLIQVWRGKITDIHVMEREQRGGPFLVAILSSAVGAGVLKFLNAPVPVWGIGVVLAVNGIFFFWISSYWKISMHVSVLSSTILAAVLMIQGVSLWALGWMVPALIWARITRGRHTIWQGMGGAGVASLLTAGVLWLIYSPHVASVWSLFLRRLGQ